MASGQQDIKCPNKPKKTNAHNHSDSLPQPHKSQKGIDVIACSVGFITKGQRKRATPLAADHYYSNVYANITSNTDVRGELSNHLIYIATTCYKLCKVFCLSGD